MIQHFDQEAQSAARIPLWRRVTALFGLGGLMVALATMVAFAVGVAALLMVVLLEQAIG